jgi:hypothetical protein
MQALQYLTQQLLAVLIAQLLVSGPFSNAAQR